MIEIPYAEMPLPVEGPGLKTAFVKASQSFKHDVLIISGVKTADDVMRGEESQLAGCIEPGQTVKNELYIFPGTHSKHIHVTDDKITGLKTYMTGEVFALLSQNSILKNNVASKPGLDEDCFKQGIKDAVSANLLNAIFKVRTNQLFDVYTKNQNFSYLSGLLIGAELKDVVATGAAIINLVCSGDLSKCYSIALTELLPGKRIKIFPVQQADEASVKGQLKIGKRLKFLA
jgi:2-dehydro-3-deoxygalactonokinase